MKDIKDNFSQQAGTYAQFRPTYPPALYQFLLSHVSSHHAAWDCGTGNGQVAAALARNFKKVYATDISGNQLEHAIQANNITYKTERAEAITAPDNSFDLVTVAQAIHWFDFDGFYREVIRTARNGALLAIWTYHLIRVEPDINAILDDFYYRVVGPYWDAERKYIDQHYQTIPFPFEEIATPNFEIKDTWTLDHLIGYLCSWSSVMHYIQQNDTDPVTLVADKLSMLWSKDEEKAIIFPLYMRMGRIAK